MNREFVVKSMANKEMTIQELKSLISEAEGKGATHIKYWWSGDARYPYEWIDFKKYKSEKEVKLEKIQQLRKEIESLK